MFITFSNMGTQKEESASHVLGAMTDLIYMQHTM